MSYEEKLIVLMAAYIVSGDLDPKVALEKARAALDTLQAHLTRKSPWSP